MWQIVGHWSYSGNPSTSDRNTLRFLIGDTDDREQLVADEEIDWALTDCGDVRAAASVVCDAIAARFSREADTTLNPGGGIAQTQALSQRARAYALLAQRFNEQSASHDCLPYAGGIDVTVKETNAEDETIVQPIFHRGQFDNPRTPNTTPDITEITR